MPMSRSLCLVLTLIALSHPVLAQRAGDGGRFGDLVESGDDESEYRDYQEAHSNPLSYYGSGCACLVLILLVAGLTSSVSGRPRGSGRPTAPGAFTPTYNRAEEDRQIQAELEADELDEIREALLSRPPRRRPPPSRPPT